MHTPHLCWENKQLWSNYKPLQLSLRAQTITHSHGHITSVEQSFIFQSHTVERRVHTHSIKNEQNLLIQLSNTNWELHPGRRKNTMHTRCVHVCHQWYKIHIKYICRINTARIQDIQHTLEQRPHEGVEGEKGLGLLWVPLTCLIGDDLENSVKRYKHNYISLMYARTALTLSPQKTKWEERSFLLSWSCYQSWKYSLVSLCSDFWLGRGYRKLTSWLLSSTQAVNRELAVGLAF